MKCSRCGGTDQVQSTLMPEVPALCIRCIEAERNTEWLHDAAHRAWEYGWDVFSHQQIVENRLW